MKKYQMEINHKYISTEVFQNFSSDYSKHTDEKFWKASVPIYLQFIFIWYLYIYLFIYIYINMYIYIYIYIYHINCVTRPQQSAQLVERFITNKWWKTFVYNLKFHACCNHQVYILILISKKQRKIHITIAV